MASGHGLCLFVLICGATNEVFSIFIGMNFIYVQTLTVECTTS